MSGEMESAWTGALSLFPSCSIIKNQLLAVAAELTV